MRIKFRPHKVHESRRNSSVWNVNSKDWERKGIWFQKGSKYLEIFLLKK